MNTEVGRATAWRGKAFGEDGCPPSLAGTEAPPEVGMQAPALLKVKEFCNICNVFTAKTQRAQSFFMNKFFLCDLRVSAVN
jgi:hypothetical protein